MTKAEVPSVNPKLDAMCEMLKTIHDLNERNKKLEAQIEKMKADVKQGQSYWNSGEMQYDLYQRLLDKWEIKEK